MKSLLLAALLTATLVEGRENPFFASDPSKGRETTSNIPDTIPSLGAQSFTLPSQTRLLKEATFTVQNVDGSIETHTMTVERTVDWHRPLVISQGSSSSSSASTSVDFERLKISAQGKRLTIAASDLLSRHFALTSPNRIVIDFIYSGAIGTSTKKIGAGVFESATINSHGKFMRLEITLDGRYAYTLKQNGNQIAIVCR